MKKGLPGEVALSGVSLEIGNFCTLRLFFDLVINFHAFTLQSTN